MMCKKREMKICSFMLDILASSEYSLRLRDSEKDRERIVFGSVRFGANVTNALRFSASEMISN